MERGPAKREEYPIRCEVSSYSYIKRYIRDDSIENKVYAKGLEKSFNDITPVPRNAFYKEGKALTALHREWKMYS